jgi:hypothetical protein
MRTYSRKLFGPALLVLVLALAVGAFSSARAAVVTYVVTLNGPSESPPNASAGTGTGTVEIDAVAHTMRVQVTFSGLTGTTTASHIHAATAVALAGTAGVATTTPTFSGFPLGVTSGSYDSGNLDMTQASSYNPAYVTAHGGTTTQAETDLFAAIAAGKAYLNIHSTFVSSGEIRGFLLPSAVPTEPTTWGKVKALYR